MTTPPHTPERAPPGCPPSGAASCHTRGVLPRRHVALAALALVGAASGALAGCGDDSQVASDAERFCGEATINREMIISPPLATEDEVAATLDFYRLMGDLAPIAIAEEWNELVHAMETASTLVPGDEASEQLVAMTAYATERSAYEVKVWLQRNCGVDLPITTIAPQEPLPPPTTTLPGTPTIPTTTAPAG